MSRKGVTSRQCSVMAIVRGTSCCSQCQLISTSGRGVQQVFLVCFGVHMRTNARGKGTQVAAISVRWAAHQLMPHSYDLMFCNLPLQASGPSSKRLR